MTDPRIAWAAGLFEGEGTITTSQKWPVLALSMTDRDVVKRFYDIIGCGYLYEIPARQAHHKPQLKWKVGSASDVRNVLNKLLPFFGDRRAYKALNTLDTIELK